MSAQTRIVSSSRTPTQYQEVDSEQVGSANRGIRKVEMGVMRCQAGQAWVALKYKRGSAIDGLQIGCARLNCPGTGPCTWSSADWHYQTAGTFARGGNATIEQRCPANMAVSGFKGIANGAYAYDLQIECATMGSQMPSSFIYGYTAIPLQPGAPRVYATRSDSLTGRAMGEAVGSVRASCDNNVSTALSYAMGTYQGLMSTPVVQTISIYCLTSTGNSAQSCQAPDPEMQQLREQVQLEITALRQNCDAAVDHFFYSYGDAVLSTLEYLAQPRCDGQFLGKPAQDMLTALSNPAETFNQTIAAAAKAIQLFQSDPSSFFGQQAASISPAKAAQLAKLSARNFIQFARSKRTEGFGAKTPIGNQRINGPYCSPFNPFGGCNNCVLSAYAFDQSLAVKTAIRAMPTMPVKSAQLQDFLLRTYATRNLNPLHGTFGTFAHRFGLPVWTNEARLTGAMKQMGEGARGFLFMKPKNGGIGHVINIFVKNGEVYLYDAQIGKPQYWHMFTSSYDFMFYRTN